MASLDVADVALEEIPNNHDGAISNEVDEEKVAVVDAHLEEAANRWKPKQKIEFLDLLEKISRNPLNPPNITWESGGKTGFFRVPTTKEIVWNAFTSSISPLSTAFSYFVFVMTYMSKITIRRAPSDEESEMFFLFGLVAASLSPLVFCLFVLRERLEYAAREMMYYHILKKNVVIDFENVSFYTTKLFWFGLASSLWIAGFGMYQNYHLAPEEDDWFDRLDLYYSFFCVSQTIGFVVFGAYVFGIEARLVTVNQVLEWALLKNGEREKNLKGKFKSLLGRLSSADAPTSRDRQCSTTPLQALHYLGECHIVEEEVLRWVLRQQDNATDCFQKENQEEISSFPEDQRKNKLLELEKSKGFKLDLDYQVLVGFKNHFDQERKKMDDPFVYQFKTKPNYAVSWVDKSGRFARDDSIRTVRFWIRAFALFTVVAILCLEVYGIYRIEVTAAEEEAKTANDLQEFCGKNGFCDGRKPVYLSSPATLEGCNITDDSATSVPGGCSSHSICSAGNYCDFENDCYECSYFDDLSNACDSFDYDCCSASFRQACSFTPLQSSCP